MKILITGGSGTIGKAFIKEFPELWNTTKPLGEDVPS